MTLVSMAKKFLPLLIAKRHSFIVNMCSVAGFFTGPATSAYSTSKYAFESFSDCLRHEMALWELHVNSIELGATRTLLMERSESAVEAFWKELPSDVKQ